MPKSVIGEGIRGGTDNEGRVKTMEMNVVVEEEEDEDGRAAGRG